MSHSTPEKYPTQHFGSSRYRKLFSGRITMMKGVVKIPDLPSIPEGVGSPELPPKKGIPGAENDSKN